eukprot:2621122-Rhodomonas_salina.1
MDDILGSWVQTDAGSYELVSCPPGHSLVNSMNGDFNHNVQQCKPCLNGTEYIIRPNEDVCQRCPPGLLCFGDDRVVPVPEGSVWVQDG